MVEKIKFFLDADVLTELEDQYVGRENDLRKELQTFIKSMFANAKAEHLTKILLCNIEVSDEHGIRTIKNTPIPFKDIDFAKYKVVFNPEWKPKKIENCAVYELTVGDSTYKKLLDSAQAFMVRVDKYNESVQDMKKKVEVPTCFEEIMFMELYKVTMDLIFQRIGKTCEDEFEEINKEIKKLEYQCNPSNLSSELTVE